MSRPLLALAFAAALHPSFAAETQPVAVKLPFPEALQQAKVEVGTMLNGQHESLLLGNGDLYGIVWQKDDGLFMRLNKNDIWDARVHTSKDGDLPRVDLTTYAITRVSLRSGDLVLG